MPYDLMLLADPGPAREAVLHTLREAPEFRPDPEVETRFWLQTPHGEAQVNIGTKDPVESVHVEFALDRPALSAAVTRRTLELGEQLGMRVEDMQYGHEIALADLPRLQEHWEALARRVAEAAQPAPRRPWWRPW
jgi:hypothetical protein